MQRLATLATLALATHGLSLEDYDDESMNASDYEMPDECNVWPENYEYQGGYSEGFGMDYK